MSSWTVEEDCKLLIAIIMANCPNANTKNAGVGGRTALACHRRFVALKAIYDQDLNGMTETDGATTPHNLSKTTKPSVGNISTSTTPSGTKRKASDIKKGTAKKVKKEERENVGSVDAWLNNVEQ